ncbi:unnamed protein product [Protopolystoma xenopodis]|uniref:Uncharacterized protein n=1 Tax=Protopolystoma xenopodis TaxID=117903 RepID=A0A3S5CC29_9PLAT|nr:unnamed protein product [Protopolystoma xenopodis]
MNLRRNFLYHLHNIFSTDGLLPESAGHSSSGSTVCTTPNHLATGPSGQLSSSTNLPASASVGIDVNACSAPMATCPSGLPGVSSPALLPPRGTQCLVTPNDLRLARLLCPSLVRPRRLARRPGRLPAPSTSAAADDSHQELGLPASSSPSACPAGHAASGTVVTVASVRAAGDIYLLFSPYHHYISANT